MAKFLSLNGDVQRLILRSLPPESLSAMCRVHSTIRHLAEENLYREINLAWNTKPWIDPDSEQDSCDDLSDPTDKWKHPLIPLLRSLIHRPDLTAYIRAITYSRKPGVQTRRGEITTYGYFTLPGSPLNEAIALVAQIGPAPYRDVWLRTLADGRIDAYIGFLLTQLPRVQSLYLDQDVFIESFVVKEVLASLLGPPEQKHPWLPFATPGSLRNLKAVRISRTARDHPQDKNLAMIENTNNACDLHFFHLPLVKELKLNQDVTTDPDIFRAAGIPRPQAPCTTLTRLQVTGLREAHLPQLLSIAPRLQSFHWLWFYWDGSPRTMGPCNTPTIGLDLLIPALLQIKDTLTELNIHAMADDPWGGTGIMHLQISGSTRGLAGMSALKRLTIPLVFLTGFISPVIDDPKVVAESLPRNLEILTLRNELYTDVTYSDYWDEAAFTACLLPWLADVEKYTPHMIRVCLVSSYPDGDKIREKWNIEDPEWEYLRVRRDIRELAQRSGIRFHIFANYPWFPEPAWDPAWESFESDD